jgi:hypothetical protein
LRFHVFLFSVQNPHSRLFFALLYFKPSLPLTPPFPNNRRCPLSAASVARNARRMPATTCGPIAARAFSGKAQKFLAGILAWASIPKRLGRLDISEPTANRAQSLSPLASRQALCFPLIFAALADPIP